MKDKLVSPWKMYARSFSDVERRPKTGSPEELLALAEQEEYKFGNYLMAWLRYNSRMAQQAT